MSCIPLYNESIPDTLLGGRAFARKYAPTATVGFTMSCIPLYNESIPDTLLDGRAFARKYAPSATPNPPTKNEQFVNSKNILLTSKKNRDKIRKDRKLFLRNVGVFFSPIM